MLWRPVPDLEHIARFRFILASLDQRGDIHSLCGRGLNSTLFSSLEEIQFARYKSDNVCVLNLALNSSLKF
jgi:hypothetical protein